MYLIKLSFVIKSLELFNYDVLLLIQINNYSSIPSSGLPSLANNLPMRSRGSPCSAYQSTKISTAFLDCSTVRFLAKIVPASGLIPVLPPVAAPMR